MNAIIKNEKGISRVILPVLRYANLAGTKTGILLGDFGAKNTSKVKGLVDFVVPPGLCDKYYC